MAENTVVLTLKLYDEMTAKLEAASKAQREALNQSKNAFASLGNEIKSSFTSALKGAVIGYLGFQSIQRVTGFLKDARMEFKEQVQMQAQLRAALGYTSQALNEQAAALGRKLVVDNEEITAVQIKIANYVKNDEQVRKLTPAVLDLAAATGMDMASAANIVARSIADDNDELGRFKIAVDGARGSSERIDSVIQGLNSTFRDGAAALAESKDGFDQMAVSWNNFKEKVGGSDLIRMWSDGAARIVDLWTSGMEQLLGQSKNEAQSEAEIAKNTTDKKIALERDAAERKERIRKDNVEKYKKFKEEESRIAEQTKQDFITGYTMQEESRIALMEEGIEKEFALLDLKYNMQREQYKNNKIMLIAIDQWYANTAELLIKKDKEKPAAEVPDWMVGSGKNIAAQMESPELAIRKLQADEQKKSEDQAKAHSEQMVATYSSMAIQMGQAFASGFEKGGGGIKGVLKETLKIWLGFIEAQMVASIFANYTKNFATLGPMGLLKASLEATAVTALFETAKVGINKFATGTAYAGGMALVGENGPEMVNLPRGAQVYNNTQTRNMTTSTALTVYITDASGTVLETARAQLRSGQGDQFVNDLKSRMARMI